MSDKHAQIRGNESVAHESAQLKANKGQRLEEHLRSAGSPNKAISECLRSQKGP